MTVPASAIAAATAHQNLQVRIGADNANRLLELSQTTNLSMSALVDAWDSAYELRGHDETKAWELLEAAISKRVHPELAETEQETLKP